MGWAYKIDEDTGDLIQDPVTLQLVRVGTFTDEDGNKVVDGTDLQPDLIIAVGTPLGSYRADPALGSTVDEILRMEPALGIEPLLEQSIETSLQTLIDAGRLTLQDVTVVLDKNRANATVNALELNDPFELLIGTI